MVWRYVALNALAQEVCGLDFGKRKDVMARLTAQGFLLVSLEADLWRSLCSMSLSPAIPAGRLAYFFKDSSNMLAAGLTMNHILQTFNDAAFGNRIVIAARYMAKALGLGQSLAQAMDGTRVFPSLSINAIRSGERAGLLPGVMELLAEYYQLNSELEGKWRHALIYPLGIFLFLCCALVYVSNTVIPALVPLLPPEAMAGMLTRFLLAVGQFVRHGWVFLSVGMGIAAFIAVIYARCYPDGLARGLCGIPVVGALQRDKDISFCFFDIYILLKSGIPLDAALAQVEGSGYSLSRKHLGQCRQYLAAGHTFAQALAESGYFPPLVIETMRIGEQVGCYEEYCERVFKVYYSIFQGRVNAMVSVTGPVLLAVCAVCIMAFAFGFLQPIYANLTHMGVFKQ